MRMIKQGAAAIVKIFVTQDDDHITGRSGLGGYASYLDFDGDLGLVNADTVVQWRGRPGTEGDTWEVELVAGVSLSLVDDDGDQITTLTFVDGVTTVAELEELIDSTSTKIHVAVAGTPTNVLTAVDDEGSDTLHDGDDATNAITVYARRGTGRWQLVWNGTTVKIIAVGEAMLGVGEGVTLQGFGEYDLHIPEGFTDALLGELSFHVAANGTSHDPADVRVQVIPGLPGELADVNVTHWRDTAVATPTVEGIPTVEDATLQARLTSTRAGYLDNLNVGGLVASAANLASAAGVIASIFSAVDTEIGSIESKIDAIQADTAAMDGRLPADPADASVVAGLIGALELALSAEIDALPTAAEIDAELSSSHGDGSWESAGSAEDVASAVFAYEYEPGRTFVGHVRRWHGMMVGKGSGLISSLATFFRPDGVTKVVEFAQNVLAGTREAMTEFFGADTP